jgi:hypothetical protein
MMKTALGVAPSWAASDAAWGMLAEDAKIRGSMVRLGGQPQDDTLYGRNDEGEAAQTYVSQVPRGRTGGGSDPVAR